MLDLLFLAVGGDRLTKPVVSGLDFDADPREELVVLDNTASVNIVPRTKNENPPVFRKVEEEVEKETGNGIGTKLHKKRQKNHAQAILLKNKGVCS